MFKCHNYDLIRMLIYFNFLQADSSLKILKKILLQYKICFFLLEFFKSLFH